MMMKKILYLFAVLILSSNFFGQITFNGKIKSKLRIEGDYLVIEGYLTKQNYDSIALAGVTMRYFLTNSSGVNTNTLIDINDQIKYTTGYLQTSQVKFDTYYNSVIVEGVYYARDYNYNYPDYTGWFTDTIKNLFRVDVKLKTLCENFSTNQLAFASGISTIETLGTATPNYIPNSSYQSGSFNVNKVINPVVSGPTTTLNNSTVTFTAVSGNSGYTTQFNWLVPSDWQILSGHGTSQISVQVGSTSGSVIVNESISTCHSVDANHFVTVNSCNTSTPTAYNPNVIAIGSDFCNIKWNGTADIFKLKYKLHSASAFTIVNLPGSQHEYSITGLEGNRYYEYLIISINNCQPNNVAGTNTGSHFFTTSYNSTVTVTDPCAKPNGVYMSDLTTNSATINWSDKMISSKYKIWVYNYEKQQNVFYAETTTHSISVTGLNPNGTQLGTKHYATLAPYCNGSFQNTTSYRFVIYSDDIAGQSNRLTAKIIDDSEIEINSNQLEVALFPNPATESAILEINSQEQINSTIVINDIFGSKIYTTEVDLEIGNNKMELNLNDYNSGIYFVVIQNKNSKKVIRLLKQ